MVTVLIVALFVLNHGFWVNHVHPIHTQKNTYFLVLRHVKVAGLFSLKQRGCGRNVRDALWKAFCKPECI